MDTKMAITWLSKKLHNMVGNVAFTMYQFSVLILAKIESNSIGANLPTH